MKTFFLVPTFLLITTRLFCCTSCNPFLKKAIAESTFYPNLLTMLSAFIVLTAMVLLFTLLAAKKHKLRLKYDEHLLSPVPLLSASIVLGIGLGGFADGILFHQVLQWHEMLSNRIPPIDLISKSVNMFWDGIFHLFCLVVVFIGVLLLWRTGKRKDADHSGKLLASGLLSGWGIFNITEGIIDHHLLKLHNVKEYSSHPEIWNFAFLGVSVLMLVAGYLLAKNVQSRKKIGC